MTYGGRASGPALVTADDVQHVVVGVRGQGVASSVESETGATRQTEFEPDIGGFRMIKLHVPVTVGRYDIGSLVSQSDLGEGRPVRWETPGGKCVAT